jgi:hypothetical protein
MRSHTALSLALTFPLLAGCAAGGISPSVTEQPVSVIPTWMRTVAMRVLPPQPFVFAVKPKTGIYAAEFWGSDVLGYRGGNNRNKSASCKVTATYVNGFGVDHSGNLVVPNGFPTEVSIYKGPTMCGKPMATFSDPYGQASDAATENATTGTIVVGNIEVGSGNKAGNVAICSVSKGCTRVLKNSHIKYYGGGVALAKNGDCWFTSENNQSLSGARLTYFKRCAGSGQTATGWKNKYYGGLIIDHAGNLISVDFNTPAVWVYKGCNPACQVVGGPFQLQGISFYGGLNAKGTELALGDAQYGQVDVYGYSPTALTYRYSFNRGLTQTDNVEAAGFAPGM